MKIALIGSGNVATHIGRALRASGHSIAAVCSPTAEHARQLAESLGCAMVSDPAELPLEGCDMVLIAVADRAVEGVSGALPTSGAIVAHTSGSVPMEVLSRRHPRAGVFYPLQTFSKEVEVDMSAVPLFIEGVDDEVAEVLAATGRTISRSVHYADSTVRARLHIAGVLTSNFPIYLLEMAREVLGDISLDVVEPLAFATLRKAFDIGPEAAMTGPARRGDVAVVRKQAAALTDELQRKIYEDISKAILKKYHSEL